jgi:hypothetical protein
MAVFMQPIYTQTVGASAVSSITFNNIPQGFTDLQLEISGRTNFANVQGGIYMYLNGNANSVYSGTFLIGNGSAISSSRQNTNIGIFLGECAGANATSNTFSSHQIKIPNYSKGNLKDISTIAVAETNGAAAVMSTTAALSNVTSPVTSLTITSFGYGNFVQYSTFTLYGISAVYDTQIPTAPTIGAVTDLAGFASVAFTAASNDQADVYVVTSSPSGSTTYGQSTPIVTPAVLGTSYTYQVTSVNPLGSSASSASSAVTTANNYASIASASGDGTATAVLFTNIPQNYKNLQIRYQARSIRAFVGEGWYIRFNGDSSASYYGHYAYVTESAGGASYGTNGAGTTVDLPTIPGASAASNMPGVGIADINNYASSEQFKTVKSIGGYDNNGSTSFLYLNVYTWQSYSPVTTIQVLSNGGLVTGSRIELFGTS